MDSSAIKTVVKTRSGTVVGQVCTSIYNDQYISFECIPYAQPPLGSLRFKAPNPVNRWKKTLYCRQKGEKPLQYNRTTNALEGVENCLYLNVYVKSLTTPNKLPMLVFFFGGGFEKGDPTRDQHGPDYFMMHDVVVVTVSYRVGVLGFLSLKDPAAGVPGNAGLKDQLLAMKWISQNAGAFNADEKNITAFGESAGAASVHYLMMNPAAQGLFQKAIMQSGTALCSWALCPVPNLPQRLAEHLGMKNVDRVKDVKVLEFLQNLPAEKLVKPYLLKEAEELDDCIFQFGPVIEPYHSANCIIPKHPSEMLLQAWGNKIPLLISGTSFEGLLMYDRVQSNPYLLTRLKTQPHHMLPREIKGCVTKGVARLLGKRIRRLHFGDRPLDMEPDSVEAYCEYSSYKAFWHPILRSIRPRIKNREASTYLYRFDFDSSTFNHKKLQYSASSLPGAAHVDDHSYIWYGDFSWKLDRDTDEFQTINRMTDILTSFAARSNPNCPSIISDLKGNTWMPVTTRNFHCLNISQKTKIKELPELKKLKVWDSIYKL